MDWREIPSLAALRAFEAAARHGSYSAAARELNVSHAAIAQHVRALEAHFGQSLMQRAGRGMEPSAAGQRLAGSLASGFSEIAQGVRALASAGEDGPLSVTTTRTFAENWLMPRLPRFWAAYPDIALKIATDDRVADLARSEHHLAIRYGRGDWPGVEARFLRPARNVIVATPELLDRLVPERGADCPLPIETLKALPWLVDEGYSDFVSWLAQYGLEVDALGARRIEGNALVLAATRAGGGVSVQPEAVVQADLDRGALICVLQDCDSAAGYYIARVPGPVPERVRLFTRWLNQEVAAQV
ncbi:MAG: LysR family transcriptional regulator [Pseudomonadota bacterium]